MKDVLIDDGYRVDRKVGEGGFGLVYPDGPEVLKGEAKTYKALAGGPGIPRVQWFGEECDFHVLVQDLLGPSLED
ncbi:hypothetical protein B0T25DRAFT_57040 [Lasiosphaeria hispida]|uniref:Protein kinase domain-containing protein n=1 Tax=Lasiosphaeria hispida TaxID=260671 RepID=A0AAJ0HWJ8_9PEZI|nr:hypothetical protein B0T25DRAFT_57040 [Lasiosphaeria hispida]